MTVVTDTSVVLNLCVIEQQEVLPRLFGDVLAPTEVVFEFQRLATEDARFQGLVFPCFIQIAAPVQLLPSLAAARRLQAGEIAALSLAVERHADAVLLDERAGRAAAVSLGLRPVGLLGILLEAKDSAMIPALAPLLDRLEHVADFWIGASLRASVLRDAGETT